MVSPLVLHAPPAVGFEAPFEMLGACHERVERTLRLLERLARHLHARGDVGPAQSAARDILRYFDLAAPLHHEDEEKHVFPPLIAGPDPEVAALALALQQEHQQLAQAWQALRLDLQQVLQATQPWPAYEARTRSWQAFADQYRAHLQREDQLVYPVAQALLDAPTCALMGQEMAARRGQRPA